MALVWAPWLVSLNSRSTDVTSRAVLSLDEWFTQLLCQDCKSCPISMNAWKAFRKTPSPHYAGMVLKFMAVYFFHPSIGCTVTPLAVISWVWVHSCLHLVLTYTYKAYRESGNILMTTSNSTEPELFPDCKPQQITTCGPIKNVLTVKHRSFLSSITLAYL